MARCQLSQLPAPRACFRPVPRDARPQPGIWRSLVNHGQLVAYCCAALSILTAALYADDGPHSERLPVPESIAALIQQGDYQAAQAALEREGSGENDLLLAWILLKQDRQAEAAQRLSASWGEGTPTPEQLRRALAVAADCAPQLAERLYADYVRKYPSACSSPDVALLIVMVKSRLGKVEEAKSLVEAVIDAGYSGGALREALLTLSNCLQTMGQPAEAVEYLSRLFELFPEASLDPAYKMQMAHALNAADMPAKALAIIDQIEGNNPDYATSNGHLLTLAKGVSYEAIGDRSQSLAYWTKLRDMGDANPAAKAFESAAKAKIRQLGEEDAADKKASDGGKSPALGVPWAGSLNGPRVILLAVNGVAIVLIAAWIAMRRRVASR